MKNINCYKISLIILAVVSSFYSCVEELDLESLTPMESEGPLVIEATFTDELKRQQIYLSRAETRLDLVTDTAYVPYLPLGRGPRDSVNVETNATIKLIGPSGEAHSFFEAEPGTYLSNEEFALPLNTEFVLEIRTSNGLKYESSPISFSATAELSKIEARRFTEDNGKEGVAIYADGKPLIGSPDNFRYTYEETYKIVAPKWYSKEFKLSDYEPCALPVVTYNLEIFDREIENRVCYNTVDSNSIIQLNTSNEVGGNINNFQVRFIERDNFIISHRYSILVKQYVQSQQAYSFYNALQNYSDNQNVFSQVQPGPLRANVRRADGSDEIVLGYVEAASVSQKRIFFNYEDLFSPVAERAYPFDCQDDSSPETHVSYCCNDPHCVDSCPTSIIEKVHLNLITLTGENDENIGTCPGPYTYVPIACGDCTLLGSKVVPEFWIE